MKKTNIIFFTWENKIFLKKELDRWIGYFIEKYWENNISRIDKDQLKDININQELTSLPFLSDKKLIILNQIPFAGANKDSEEVKDDDSKIIDCLENIPDNNFVLFIQESPDKRKLLYKKILEIATIKDFPNLDEYGIKSYIKESLPWIQSDAIEKLMLYKNNNIEKIEQEIEKLSLYKQDSIISTDNIETYVLPEIESSIFIFLDRLLELNYDKAIINLEQILLSAKIEPTFAWIMTNLRKYLYTIYFKNNWLPDSEIINLLKLHPFVFKKNIYNKGNYRAILHIYNKFSELDEKAKNGQLIWDIDDNLRIAMEKVIFDLKKQKNLLKY